MTPSTLWTGLRTGLLLRVLRGNGLMLYRLDPEGAWNRALPVEGAVIVSNHPRECDVLTAEEAQAVAAFLVHRRRNWATLDLDFLCRGCNERTLARACKVSP